MSSPNWRRQPDGSRVKLTNGIRIVDRTCPGGTRSDAIEHLVTWQDADGSTVVLGLDAACRPVYSAAL